MSDVVIDKSADSNGACLLQFSPNRHGGTLKCAMFRFPQEESLPLLLSPPTPVGNGGLYLSVVAGPLQGEHSTWPRSSNLPVPEEGGSCDPVPFMDPTWTSFLAWPRS